MVKKSFILVLALGAMSALSQVHQATPKFSGMEESASDYVLTNKGNSLQVLRAESKEGASVEYSKTFAQSGKNPDGKYVLRFATAIKGNIEDLSYTRFAVEGATPGSAQASDNIVPVTAIYKSIEVSEGNSAYYNGKEVVHEQSDSTEGWYWACYSITYSNSTYYGKDIKVQLNINDSIDVEDRVMSLNKVRLPNAEAYKGNKYHSSDISLEFIDEYTASCSYKNHTIKDAVITDFSNEYYVFANDAGEEFKVSINNKTAFIKDIVFDGIQQSSTTYYCEFIEKMTSFALTMNGSAVSEVATYEVQVGDTKYLTMNISPNGTSTSKTFTSSNEEIATVSASNDKVLEVKFKAAGVVTITVSVTDVYGEIRTKEVHFSVVKKVFPTETNWGIKNVDANGEKIVASEITVGSSLKYAIDWLDEEPNSKYSISWKVTWEKEFDGNGAVASIINNSLNKDFGLLTANKEGLVTVTATINDEENKLSYEKSVNLTITAAGDNEILPDSVAGVWEEYYSGDFTFTVKRDGSAIFNYYGDEIFFTIDESRTEEYSYYVNYFFNCDDDGTVLVLYVSDGDCSIYLEDDEWGCLGDYQFYGETYVSKQ